MRAHTCDLEQGEGWLAVSSAWNFPYMRLFFLVKKKTCSRKTFSHAGRGGERERERETAKAMKQTTLSHNGGGEGRGGKRK